MINFQEGDRVRLFVLEPFCPWWGKLKACKNKPGYEYLGTYMQRSDGFYVGEVDSQGFEGYHISKQPIEKI